MELIRTGSPPTRGRGMVTSDAGETAHSQLPPLPHLNADVEPACTAYVPSSPSRTRNP